MVSVVLAFLAGAAVGAAAMLALAFSLRRQIEQARVDRALAEQSLELKSAEIARVKEDCERRIRERAADIESGIERLLAAANQTAAETVSRGAAALENRNRQDLQNILEPLRRQMAEFREAAEKAQRTNIGVGEAIRANIEAIGKTAAALGSKADGLVEVLKNSNKHAGVWGEEILSEVLRRSGLQEGVHFFTQQGATERPDVQVVDTQGRYIVIDAKTNLSDFMDYCNEKDEDRRRQALSKHVKAIETQVAGLAAKNYVPKLREQHPERQYLDLTAMFVPSESAYAAAMGEKPTLWHEAFVKKVVIVTPQTLLAYLTIVSLAWKQDTAEKKQLEIIAQATRLLDNINACLADIESVDAALVKTRELFDKLSTRLRDRKSGSVVAPALKLRQFGVALSAKAKRTAPELAEEA